MSSPSPNLPRGVQALLFESAERRRRVEDVRRPRPSRTPDSARRSSRSSTSPRRTTASRRKATSGSTASSTAGESSSRSAPTSRRWRRASSPRASRGLPMPVALFYRGDVVRDEPSGLGRPREFAQVGAELYGDASFEADLRMLRTLLDAAAEVPAGRLCLTLGWAGLLPAILSAVAPGSSTGRGAPSTRRSPTPGPGASVGSPSGSARRGAVAAAGGRGRVRPPRRLRPGVAALRPPRPRRSRPLPRRGGARGARGAGRASTVVVDLAGTPTAPYYTGLTFALDARGGGGPLGGGGRYDGLLGRFGPDGPGGRLLHRPRGARVRDRGVGAERRRDAAGPSGSRRGRGGSSARRSTSSARPGSTSRRATDGGSSCPTGAAASSSSS